MPANKVTGTRGLAKVREERAALEAREQHYRREAAIELGEIALAAGAEAFSGADLKTLLNAARAVGATRAIEMLKAALAAGPPAKPKGTGNKPMVEVRGDAGV